MKFIILSGGSGKRLWPLSTDKKPKQLLPVLPNGLTSESMLQRIVKQLLQYVKKEDILITTSVVHLEELQKQITDITIICEPETRDTFAAISLATLYLLDELNCSEDEVVSVISADIFTDGGFFSKIIDLQHEVKRKSAPLGLVGIRPTYPSTRFGYIERKSKEEVFEIEKFIEKPQKDVAFSLIEKGALWNSGVFVFPLYTVAEKLKRDDSTITYRKLLDNFSKFERNSFDYAIVENTNSIICIAYNGPWEDLGTWESLLPKMEIQNSNVYMTDDCMSVRVINETSVPVKILGLSNVIVVVTEQGILISDIKSSERLKEIDY